VRRLTIARIESKRGMSDQNCTNRLSHITCYEKRGRRTTFTEIRGFAVREVVGLGSTFCFQNLPHHLQGRWHHGGVPGSLPICAERKAFCPTFTDILLTCANQPDEETGHGLLQSLVVSAGA
jgi:hypothetical protein